MDKLVTAISDHQKKRQLNDADVAAKLGISRIGWIYIRTGQRKAGIKFIKGVAKNFPELTALLLTELGQ